MNWVRWGSPNPGPWHTYHSGSSRTACGVFLGADARLQVGHPPRGEACGNCLSHLAAVERFARGAMESQRAAGPEVGPS